MKLLVFTFFILSFTVFGQEDVALPIKAEGAPDANKYQVKPALSEKQQDDKEQPENNGAVNPKEQPITQSPLNLLMQKERAKNLEALEKMKMKKQVAREKLLKIKQRQQQKEKVNYDKEKEAFLKQFMTKKTIEELENKKEQAKKEALEKIEEEDSSKKALEVLENN